MSKPLTSQRPPGQAGQASSSHRCPHHAEEIRVGGLDDMQEEPNDGVDGEFKKPQRVPWWKRPAVLWILVVCPLTAIGQASTIAPRIEIYTALACIVHKPEYTSIDIAYPDSVSFHNGVVTPSGLTTGGPQPILLPSSFAIGDSIYTSVQNSTENKRTLCSSDSVVQAAVATLTVVIATSMGVLSCITTAWWGSFSDRHGRTLVLGISVIGLLCTDINFIISYVFFQYIPGGYWSLLLGPIVEGALGGMATTQAAMHAYMADCTDSESRSRIFSLYLGLLFTGIALGPTLGSLLIRQTQNTLSVFYLATLLHFVYAVLVWFIIPESLPRTQMNASAARWREEILNARNGSVRIVKRVFGFFSPMSVFAPQVVQKGNPLKRKRDWNLTLLAIAYGCSTGLMASYSYKLQFAASTFGWTSEMLGYWLSIIATARVVYLMAILPLAIRLIKRNTVMAQPPAMPTETEPLLAENSSTTDSTTPPGPLTSPAFDLGLARISIIIEIVSYVAVIITPTPMTFTALGVFSAFGAGLWPALKSVALEMYNRGGGTESGRLFGGLSVVNALCAQIIGPAIFGVTYMYTVATFPRGIFFLSVGTLMLAAISLSVVRLHNVALGSDLEAIDTEYPVHGERIGEEALVREDAEGGVVRSGGST